MINRIIIATVGLLVTVAGQAAVPLITFTPLTSTSISITSGESATIEYLVTAARGSKSHTWSMRPITEISQDTSIGHCASPFTLSASQSCTLALNIDGSSLSSSVVGGPVLLVGNNSNMPYQPGSPANSLDITLTSSPGMVTLSSSVSTLVLSVNDPTFAALTGTPRTITITSTGTATGVSYSASSSLPSDATITPLTCGTITPASPCVLTITPGSTPSATPGDTNPTPITLTIAGSNTNTLAPTVNILTYGSVYQSGYVYAVDDSTPNTGSIGGKAMTLSDRAEPDPSGIVWSSNGAGSASGDVSRDIIPGIDETSTTGSESPLTSGGASTDYTFDNMFDSGATYYTYNNTTPTIAFSACNGATDGACNQGNIILFYSQFITNYIAGDPTPFTATAGPTDPTYYAAGRCEGTIDGNSDWYLPAICEMGYDSVSGCGTSGSPTLQNMQSNLVDNAVPDLTLIGYYWSSTEFFGSPQNYAWLQDFASGGSSVQNFSNKISQLGVRCSRALTF
ncbi:MAG: DUF1566 domain-containing protein [Legionellaceae bacterium]|nr:DUF1566 domain-containing protein [Legionellaceae bacterium]